MSANEIYEFRDPVHGFIQVNDLELKIIDSFPFQRLRNIKQLAFSHSTSIMEQNIQGLDIHWALCILLQKHSGQLLRRQIFLIFLKKNGILRY